MHANIDGMESTKDQEDELREPEVFDLEASEITLEEFLALLDRIDEDDRVYLTREGRRYIYLRRTRDTMVESTTKEEREDFAKHGLERFRRALRKNRDENKESMQAPLRP